MTTTTASLSIPLSSTHPQLQQPFKLLELPPDLLTLLESHDPPTLQITSHATPPHHAHLHTSNGKKYALRLKSSSNPMLLVLPVVVVVVVGVRDSDSDSHFDSHFYGGDGDGDGDGEKRSRGGQRSLTRISTVEETIELVEVKGGGGR
ncbi:hypothetical protein EYC80_002008 [Monilinia laxa]|uniref:Sister chromatid cohesion protein DCC1 n=1 Tax=Monilinia laxa TaxID=61186 RepID=A0A5N6K7J0_MONLA|nr:hypothetical protein EYC80_002008 [Monilinia laxa]